MNNNICRNCGAVLTGNVCEKCGYSVNISNPYQNIIKDIHAKEEIGDQVITFLANGGHISLKNDLKFLKIEFGYLFLNNDNQYESLLKVTVPKKLFNPNRVFYIALQKEKILLLNGHFDEKLFRKTANDMLLMHEVDLDNLNQADYIMQLY